MDPLALVFLCVLCPVVLLGGRIAASAAILASVCLMTMGQLLVLGPFHLHFFRLVILVGLARVLARGELQDLRGNRIDAAILVWLVVLVVTSPGHQDPRGQFINVLGTSVNTVVAYFVFRALIRNTDDVAGVGKLRAQARLVSPVDGIVSARLVEPGTTLVAGQAVVQVIDPSSLWIKARIDQGQAGSVRAGQPVEIVLRSDASRTYPGTVERIDWVSDPVTEERIVNIGFTSRPEAIPVGELVEVTIRTALLANARSVPAAAVKRVDRREGLWQVASGRATFRPVKIGVTTLDGRSQIVDGLDVGAEVVVHSEQPLQPDTRVKVVATLVHTAP